jgi:hypothetical protein
MTSMLATPILGFAHARAGALGRGLALLTGSVEYTAARQLLAYQPMRLGAPGEALLHAGRAEEAQTHAAQAVDWARAQEESGQEAHGLRLLGETAACGPTPETADAHYRAALGLGYAVSRGTLPQAHL